MNEEKKKHQKEKARQIIERLKRFNRKERDHLVKLAYCEDPKEPRITKNLWEELVGPNTDIPPSADLFIGMDYHINWLYAALATANVKGDLRNGQWQNGSQSKRNETQMPIQGNQEDVDLLVSWIDPDNSRLKMCLVEAKLESGWSSSQLISKRKRLALMLQEAENELKKAEKDPGLDFVDFYFFLCSPKKPEKWNLSWPQLGFEERWNVKFFNFESQENLLHVKRVSKDSTEWQILGK